jgi:hypothetical protein
MLFSHIFGHDSTGFSNCPTYDPAYLEMSLIGFLVALDLFAFELLTRLVSTDGICNQRVYILQCGTR